MSNLELPLFICLTNSCILNGWCTQHGKAILDELFFLNASVYTYLTLLDFLFVSVTNFHRDSQVLNLISST